MVHQKSYSVGLGWWFEALWKILVSWDYSSQYMESHKSHVPNQQPGVIYPIIPVYPNLSPWYPQISWSHLQQPRMPRHFPLVHAPLEATRTYKPVTLRPPEGRWYWYFESELSIASNNYWRIYLKLESILGYLNMWHFFRANEYTVVWMKWYFSGPIVWFDF
jgi:hypothetical protein